MGILLRELGKVKALLPVLQLGGNKEEAMLGLSLPPLNPSSLRIF